MPDKPVSAVFDLDGVLIDSGPYHYESWKQLARLYGLDFPESLFRETFGMPNFLILPRLFRKPDMSVEEIRRLSDQKEELFRKVAGKADLWLPGARECLERLKQSGIPLALYTSTPRSNVLFFKQNLGLDRYFKVIITGDDVSRGKPDPEGFLLAMDALHCPPEQCVIFEDSPAGIEAGRKAGAIVVALTTTHPAEKLKGAHCYLSDLSSVDRAFLETIVREYSEDKDP